MEEKIKLLFIKSDSKLLSIEELENANIQFDTSLKKDLLYAFEMGKLTTLKPGGLNNIDEIISKLQSYEDDSLLHVTILTKDGKDVTLFADLDCSKIIVLFDEL